MSQTFFSKSQIGAHQDVGRRRFKCWVSQISAAFMEYTFSLLLTTANIVSQLLFWQSELTNSSLYHLTTGSMKLKRTSFHFWGQYQTTSNQLCVVISQNNLPSSPMWEINTKPSQMLTGFCWKKNDHLLPSLFHHVDLTSFIGSFLFLNHLLSFEMFFLFVSSVLLFSWRSCWIPGCDHQHFTSGSYSLRRREARGQLGL